MYVRHVLLLFAFLAGGCSCAMSHELASRPDSGTPVMGDAAPTPLDSGFYAWPDSGPAPLDAAMAVDAAPAPDLAVALNTYRLGDRMIGLGESYVWMTLVELTAGAEDVSVTGIRFHHRGTGPTDDVFNVYLYSCAERLRLTTGRTVNRTTGEVVFHVLLDSSGITIRAGETVPLVIVADYALTAAADTTHAFDLESADDIFTSRPARVSGAFPLRGGAVTFSPLIPARADLRAGTGADFAYGERGVISRFTVSGENVYLDRINLLQAGSIRMSSLQDLQLFVDGIPAGDAYVVDTVPFSSFIVLDFDNPSHTGWHLNGTREVTVTALVTDPGYDATIRTYVEYSTDVVVGDDVIMFDGVYAQARVCISSNPYGGCDAAGAASFDGTAGNLFEVTVR